MTVDEYCDQRMKKAIGSLGDWLRAHPKATQEDANKRLAKLLLRESA